ncbi:MAG: FAD-containing oxidoreductase [Rubrivivax sp.]|nr:FAD-containing oxidoreductase [Rubrivivax sp.]
MDQPPTPSPLRPEPWDAIVIGAGQAGPFLAARLAAAGQRVALIEREHLGGTCVNDGCMPTKTLVASARAAHVARHAAHWGVRIDGAVRVDLKAVKARKDAVVAQSVANLTQWLGSMPTLEVIAGHGRFTAPTVVQVNDRRLAAPRIFVNVGGRPLLPDWPGIDDVPVLTNTTLLELDELPEHLVIAGGSYIGLEFAQIYRRFGSRVTVLESAPRLIAREDPEISRAVRELLEAEGVTFHVGVSDVRVRRAAATGSEVELEFHTPAGPRRVSGTHLLAAVGRRPNTEDLGLEHAGLVTDARGAIPVDDELRTAVDGIWALGDVHGRGAFTHTSYHDHEIVAAKLLDGAARSASDGGEGRAPSVARSIRERIPAYALFVDPPLARIGASEVELRAAGRPFLKGTLPMARVGRARERGETVGAMKVLVEPDSQRILGAALLGIEADEVIHELLLAMHAGLTVQDLQRLVHIHPTVSEQLPTLLGTLVPVTPELAAPPAAPADPAHPTTGRTR